MKSKDLKIVIGASIISTFMGAVGGAVISEYRHDHRFPFPNGQNHVVLDEQISLDNF